MERRRCQIDQTTNSVKPELMGLREDRSLPSECQMWPKSMLNRLTYNVKMTFEQSVKLRETIKIQRCSCIMFYCNANVLPLVTVTRNMSLVS